jgi:hypothetical protein
MPVREGSFVRWQSITLTQLGYAVNLFLGFAGASLGFALALIKESSGWGLCLLFQSCFLFFVSLVAGTSCVVNRLLDFSKTARIARITEKWQGRTMPICKYHYREALRLEAKRHGKLTWRLLCWQISFLGGGLSFLLTAFVISYGGRLV